MQDISRDLWDRVINLFHRCASYSGIIYVVTPVASGGRCYQESAMSVARNPGALLMRRTLFRLTPLSARRRTVD